MEFDLKLQQFVDWKVYNVIPIKKKFGYRALLIYADGSEVPQQKSGFETVANAARACLKNAFCQMCVTICTHGACYGRFAPNEGRIAGYVTSIWRKSGAKWGVQMAGMIFQTRSRDKTIGELYSGTYVVYANVKVKDFMVFWLEKEMRPRITSDSYGTYSNYCA